MPTEAGVKENLLDTGCSETEMRLILESFYGGKQFLFPPFHTDFGQNTHIAGHQIEHISLKDTGIRNHLPSNSMFTASDIS